MEVERLVLYNFRNFKELTAEFAPGVNFICGRNGAGKTSLIEAISLVSTAKSFRTSRLSELIHWGCGEASVFAQVRQRVSDLELGIALKGARREAFVNRESVKSFSDFMGRLLSVSFSPADVELVKGEPQSRRRFLDRHIVDLKPGLMQALVGYQRALKSKNQLLRRREAGPGELEPWNDLLAEFGVRITSGRQRLLQSLEQRSGRYYREYSSEDGQLSFELRNSFGAAAAAGDVSVARAVLRDHTERELAAGTALVGPHRDDFLIALNGNSARSFASQGQARSIVLALKLGVISLLEEHHSDSPVLLLDDVDSELDPGRSRAFFDLILSGERQVLITGTDAAALARKAGAGSFIAVEAGQVHQLSAAPE